MSAERRVPVAASNDTRTANPSATVAAGAWLRNGRSASASAMGTTTAPRSTTTGQRLETIARLEPPVSEGVALGTTVTMPGLDAACRQLFDHLQAPLLRCVPITAEIVSVTQSTNDQRGGPNRYP